MYLNQHSLAQMGTTKVHISQARAKEKTHAAAEKISFIKPLKNPAIPKAIISVIENQSIRARFSIIL